MKAAVQRRLQLPAGQKSSFQLWLRWRTCAPLPVFFQRLWKLPASETSNGPVRGVPWKLLMIFYDCHSSSTFKLCEMCFWLSSRSFLCLSGIRRFIWGHHSFGWRVEGFYADAIHPQCFQSYFMIALEGYALARRSPDSVVPFFLDWPSSYSLYIHFCSSTSSCELFVLE